MSQDILSDVLRGIRLRGAVFYHVEGHARWVSESPPALDIAALIMPGIEHVMAWHVVTRGHCWAQLPGEAPVALSEGDVVLFPRGDAHVIASEPGLRSRLELTPYQWPRPEQLPLFASRQGALLRRSRLSPAGAEPGATLICGFFGCDATPFNPLLGSLPRLLEVHADVEPGSRWIGQFIRIALAECEHKRPGGEALLERLSETMFVELVRCYLDDLPASRHTWLAGLRDRHVGRALALLHERPGDAWSMERLADRVGLSRSALHERFLQFTGYAPMHYLACWRMQVAAGLLRQSHVSVCSVAQEVGYESEAAFSRAFRRETGLPPATWRRRQEQLAGEG